MCVAVFIHTAITVAITMTHLHFRHSSNLSMNFMLLLASNLDKTTAYRCGHWLSDAVFCHHHRTEMTSYDKVRNWNAYEIISSFMSYFCCGFTIIMQSHQSDGNLHQVRPPTTLRDHIHLHVRRVESCLCVQLQLTVPSLPHMNTNTLTWQMTETCILSFPVMEKWNMCASCMWANVCKWVWGARGDNKHKLCMQ